MTATTTGITDDQLVEGLRTMIRIRTFEERLRRLFNQGRLPGFVHLYIGEEAVATGACLALRDGDQITSNHRGHGHVIAKGADVKRMFAELLGKVDGYCRGKGGSMHIMDFASGMLGTNGIVGGGIPIATGAAYAAKHLGNGKVVVSFFGDGATNQGVFFEALNLAALWELPVLFLVENNQYTEWTPTHELTVGAITDRAVPFGIPGVRVDGNDLAAVHDAVATAAARARAGHGPSVIECVTYRWHGHNEGEEAFAGDYRPREEIEHWMSLDPIARLAGALVERGVLTADDVDRIRAEEHALVEAGYEFALASPSAPDDEALSDVFASTVSFSTDAASVPAPAASAANTDRS